jgi:hypothetical protein
MSTLGAYLTNKLETWAEVDGVSGFEVKVAYLSREELNKIRAATSTTKFNRATRQPEQVTDDELFVKEYVKATVLDWKGLTLKAASQLMPMSFDDEVDLTTEVEFSPEDAQMLVEQSTIFDTWLNDVALDLSRFPTTKAGKKPRAAKKVSAG